MVLAGADKANYTVSQPVGLTAAITPLGLTIAGAVASPKVYNGDNVATVDFTVTNWLLGGDIVTTISSTSIDDTDNLVNAVDLGLLLGYYLNGVGSDAMIGRADIDGDGVVDMVNAVDLSVLLGNYLVSGDAP